MRALLAAGAGLALVVGCTSVAPEVETPPVATPLSGAEAPSAFTLASHSEFVTSLPFADTRDFNWADRGFVATRKDPKITGAAGQVVWDLSAFDFLKAPPPPTVNPSLWRQGQLMAKHGLYQVSDNIWQVRGFDLANITFVKGMAGWIVIDTLGSNETAKAAFRTADRACGRAAHRGGDLHALTHGPFRRDGGPGLAGGRQGRQGAGNCAEGLPARSRRRERDRRPGDAEARDVPVRHSAAQGRRRLVNAGIGPGLSTGSTSLIPPTREIGATGETLTIDGVKMVFQFTPGTEAPAEMNVWFPDWKIVDMAENANATQHNILTPRGAVVRDAKVWAEGLTQSLRLFGEADILIASHGWPRFGNPSIRDYLGKHRDAYAFLHDQTVRLMNKGMNGDEIAATLELPEVLAQEWYDRPYYGSYSFNSRAVYQFYMGWYDANPVNLAPMPPVETGKRYVAAMGGADSVKAKAREAYDAGDYAWAAELLNHVVMADGADAEAKDLLARSYDQLGWQAEPSTWRNIYLTVQRSCARVWARRARTLRGRWRPSPTCRLDR